MKNKVKLNKENINKKDIPSFKLKGQFDNLNIREKGYKQFAESVLRGISDSVKGEVYTTPQVKKILHKNR